MMDEFHGVANFVIDLVVTHPRKLMPLILFMDSTKTGSGEGA